MDRPDFLPQAPYLYRGDEPHVGGARPLTQGDIFVDIPLLRAAKPHPRHAGQWVSQVKAGANSLGMLVSIHLQPVADYTCPQGVCLCRAVVRCPSGFEPPWDGYYEYFPLPELRGGEDYVADLSAGCRFAQSN